MPLPPPRYTRIDRKPPTRTPPPLRTSKSFVRSAPPDGCSRPRPEPPEFFVDRSLGRHLLPDALRAAGFVVHTMVSVFGSDAEQKVDDVEWLQLAGDRNWLVLSKDARIRKRPHEIAEISA